MSHLHHPNPARTPRTRLLAIAAFGAAALAPTLANAQTQALATTAAKSDDAVQLTPFDVRADADNSYGAVNSNSLTKFNIELNKMPVSGDIFTEAFMNDIGATSVESMIQAYSPGVGNSAIDATAGASATNGDHVAHGYIQLRGFDSPILIRDSLMPVGPIFNPGSTGPGQTSNFDIEKVEVIDGPQSLLYNGGGAGGVINVTSKQARFDKPVSGSFQYQVDQYGSKLGLVDVGAGSDNVAIRVAILDQDISTRRIFIGQQTDGYYGQLAFHLFKKTTVRINVEQTTENSINGDNLTLATSAVATDSRASSSLAYLLATNQTGANTLNAAGAANASGSIYNGQLNWGNVNSLAGWLANDHTVNTFENLTADTQWAPWLSSELAFGYNASSYDFASANNTTFYAPQSATNPTGNWAIANTPGDDSEPARTKGIRFSMLASNDFMHDTAHSQTIFGVDYVRSDAASIQYNYFLADSNLNAVISPTITTFAGRTELGKSFFSIGNGPVQYGLYSPEAPYLTVNGNTYVRQSANLAEPSLKTAANPLGLTNTSLYEITKNINKGLFAANFTQWMDGKLTTLLGLREATTFDNYVIYGPQSYRLATEKSTNFEVGANYALTSWLRPYFTVSDIVTPPQVLFPDPAGNLPTSGHGTSQEIGFKFNNAASTISGSIAFYHSNGKNEEYEISSTLENDINPSGLNGRGSVGQYVDADRTTNGIQFIMTANPTPNWRLRIGAADTIGKILDNKIYSQFYNDQFNANAAGQVTYADGTLVYVNPTFSSKAPVATSTTAGAVPLTIAMMNNASSVYYANPTNPTGAISSTAAVATVLKVVDPVHGAILTGATGLPISAIQITPAFTLPGSITIAEKGDRTLGFPQYSANMTNMYTFPTGFIKGISVGGTVSRSWRTGEYYYFPNGVTSSTTSSRLLFSAPDQTRFDLIAGYSKKFRKVTWSTRLNVNNAFNSYKVVIYPDQITGYTVQANLGAALWGSPRQYVWTNTLSF